MSALNSPANRLRLGALLLLLCLLYAASADARIPFGRNSHRVASITVQAASPSVQAGSTDQFTAVAKDAQGRTVTGVSFTWSSSNTGAATINSTNGVATGVGAGFSHISATAQGVRGRAALRVTAPPSAISGVAAMGAAIGGATITLVDSTGKTTSTSTAGDGSYTLNTTGFVPPFLIAVQVDINNTLYSVSADATPTVINVDPLTDLIIRSWYSVQGTTVDSGFSDPGASPPPTPDQVQIISNVVVNVTALWLQSSGVDTSTFNPINTPFSADGSGVDAVLDEATINTDTGEISISDGTTTQTSTVSYDTDASSMSVDTTTTGPTGSSSSSTGTVVPTSSQQSALDAINATLSAFSNTITNEGSNLVAADLLPYFDDNLLDEGLDKTLFADSIANDLRGPTFAAQVESILALDTVNGLATVNFTVTRTQGPNSETQSIVFFFKQQGDDSWLFYGDQLPAKLDVHSEMRTNQGANAPDNGPDINVDIRPIKDLYSGITIDGGGVFSNTALSKNGTEVDTFTPDPAFPGTTVEVDRDEFFQNSGILNSLVPAGTAMTITLTPVSGSPVDYTVHTNAFTTEAISITNLSSSSIADANLGGTLHVEWTLPTTFAIARVKLSVNVFTGDQTQNTTLSCDSDGLILSITSTSADLPMPDTCAGLPVQQANVNLNVVGVNGEQETVIYQFQ
ncbi:MAG TPA: Ig-like domain-containing protein [Gammaproteobacteria bacterium]|nr:Ig-like domain-containing protein [Gammaproteobacteria bacterium]